MNNGALKNFVGGSLQMRGGYVLRLRDGSTIDLRDLAFRVRPDYSNILDVVGSDGRAWFYTDRLMFELDNGGRTLAVRAADVRISPALANRIGVPEASGWEVADIAMNTSIYVEGRDLAPDRVCAPYPWPGITVPSAPTSTYQADLFMVGTQYSPVGCQSCDGPGGNDGVVSIAPSSSLENNINDGSAQATVPGDPLGTSTALYTANVAWYSKFSGNNAPYNNDQHPFLIWNMYRFNADGSIEQIGRSGVKHAFLTINASCLDSCNDSHSLGRGCGDTYGTGNNDSPWDMGPALGNRARFGDMGPLRLDLRSELHGQLRGRRRQQRFVDAAPQDTRVADRSGRERGCVVHDGVVVHRQGRHQHLQLDGDGHGYAALREQSVDAHGPVELQARPRDRSLGEPDRAAREFAQQRARPWPKATRRSRSRRPTSAAATGAMSTRSKTSTSRARSRRRPRNGSDPRVVSNKGFDSFSVPLPAGSTVVSTSFSDGDLVAANNWAAVANASAVTWRSSGTPVISPNAKRQTLDWGTLFTFTVVVNKAPANGNGTLHVATAGAPASYTVASLVPGS